MQRTALSHVKTVFHPDHTLCPPDARRFGRIDRRTRAWMMTPLTEPGADRLRVADWRRFGNALAGLMGEHRVNPASPLVDVHDIPPDRRSPDPGLCDHIHHHTDHLAAFLSHLSA